MLGEKLSITRCQQLMLRFRFGTPFSKRDKNGDVTGFNSTQGLSLRITHRSVFHINCSFRGHAGRTTFWSSAWSVT